MYLPPYVGEELGAMHGDGRMGWWLVRGERRVYVRM